MMVVSSIMEEWYFVCHLFPILGGGDPSPSNSCAGPNSLARGQAALREPSLPIR